MPLGLKITLSSILSMLTVVFILSWAGISAQLEMEERFHKETSKGRSLLWSSFIKNDIQNFESDVKKLASNRKFKKALKKQEKDTIKQEVGQYFSYLFADDIVHRAYVFDPSGTILHIEGDNNSTNKNQHLSSIKLALKTGKVIKGLDLDSDSKIFEVVAIPVTLRGKLIGGVIFLKRLKNSVKLYAETAEAEAFISNADNAIITTSNQDLSQQLQKRIQEGDSDDRFFVEDLGEIYWATSIHPLYNTEKQLLGNLVVAADYTKSYTDEKQSHTVGLISTLFAVILGIVSVYFLTGYLLKPLRTVALNLEQIAAGNLHEQVEVTSEDEIGVLQASAQKMANQLKELLVSIKNITEHLHHSTDSMNELSNNGLKQSESQQKFAISINESMNEMTEKATNVKLHAQETAETTVLVETAAHESSHITNKSIKNINQLAEQIEQSCQVLQRLQEESNSISEFLGVIKGVAEQTNLLALNAAIEAARAGEAGRGFAVVADEVRSLSVRTQEAAEQIEKMTEQLLKQSVSANDAMGISKSLTEVNVQQSQETAESLQKIIGSVDTIKHMNKDIANEVSEQSAMSSRINKSIEEIKLSSVKSTESSKDIQKFSSELNNLAEKLKVEVDHFSI